MLLYGLIGRMERKVEEKVQVSGSVLMLLVKWPSRLSLGGFLRGVSNVCSAFEFRPNFDVSDQVLMTKSKAKSNNQHKCGFYKGKRPI